MYVITGATGTVGRPLVELLAAEGAAVRAVSRDPAAADLAAEVVAGDPSDPAGLTSALTGADALFLHPRAAGDAARELVALAGRLGVRRVVALAAANVDDPLDEQPSRLRGDRNKEAEDAAAGSGLEWVSLRPSYFAGNSLQAWGGQLRAGDVVRNPAAGFEESPIDERDIAAVAARALLTDDLLGQRPVLTGPESLSHARMVEIIGEVTGRPLRFEEVPPEAAAQGMIAHGLPEPFVRGLLARYARHSRQPQFPPTGEVDKILGRPARTFADWVADHAAAFRP
jgi:uncharacterized protein YbjT (DUF2867 family)